jgi:hypothetical protein
MKAKIAILLALVMLLVMPFTAAAADLNKHHEEGAGPRPVQAFDVTAGKVVKTVPNSSQYQRFAQSWLKSVTGLAPQLKADEKCGYVYRIPLNEPYTITTSGITVSTSDVFMFYCPDKPKLLLVFDENRRPYLLNFTANINPFLKTIGIP